MKVGDKLKALRLRAGLSFRVMAKAMDRKYASAYQYWETGTGSEKEFLPPDKIAAFSKVLVGAGDPPITEGELLALGLNSSDLQPEASRSYSVPLISWVQAGPYAQVEDFYEPGDHEELLDVPGVNKTCIALRVRGDSMNLIAPEDSVIIVDYSDKDLRDGRYYVVKEGEEATFKRYRANPERFEARSSLSFDPIFPKNAVQIVGRVIKVITDL